VVPETPHDQTHREHSGANRNDVLGHSLASVKAANAQSMPWFRVMILTAAELLSGAEIVVSWFRPARHACAKKR
jgi:hypothetical protein